MLQADRQVAYDKDATMALPPPDGTKNWIGRTVVDRNGAEIGVCAALLTDTETGQPEWLHVERDDVMLVVPLLDAQESGSRVHVTVTRAYADGAPRFGPTRELTREQEAALYRHYGIEYSAETSDSLLPAGADTAAASPTDTGGTPPHEAARQLITSDTVRRGSGVAAAVAVLVGLATAVVAAVRMRRGGRPGSRRLLRRATPPPAPRRLLAVPPSARARAVQVAAATGPLVESAGRLARTSVSTSAASLRRAAADSARWSTTASTAARAHTRAAATRLGPLLDTTAHTAWRAVRAGTDSALRISDAATEAVVAAVPRVTASTALAGGTGLRAVLALGAAAEAVPEAVAETGERLEKGWRSVMGKLSLGLGFGAGYVLGARAGRARYEEIKQAAAGFVQRPEVQQALDRARTAAPAPLQSSIEKLSRSGSGSQDTDAAPTGSSGSDDARTDPADDGAPSTAPVAEASLPDPLIPPAKSVEDPPARP